MVSIIAANLLLLSFSRMAAAARYGVVPLQDDHHGLLPRHFLDGSVPLVKRDGSCARGSHPCLDIRKEDACCSNERYCYINDDGETGCCPIGSNCSSNSPCSSDKFFCTLTQTASSTPTAVDACCGRRCPGTSQYLCPQSLGGNCCSYGSECRSGSDGGYCVTVRPEATSTSSFLGTEGCTTTSQHRCEDGVGCCYDWQTCTEVSDRAYCAGNPTGSNDPVVEDSSSNELSDGATAGIAVGAVFGAGLIISILTWMCISKRRKRRLTETQRSASAAAPHPQRDGDVSEVTADSRPQIGRFGTQDYFGAPAVNGPYTETVASTAATSPNPDRGVPSQPNSPGDIHAAVEIDSRAQSPESTTTSYYATPMSATIDGRFELHGAAHSYYAPQRSPSAQQTPSASRPRDELE